MIQCIPKGLCSWDLHLSGGGHSAVVDLNTMSEQGRVRIEGGPYEVIKHGFASGMWTLDEAGSSIFTAQKPNPMTRTFELSGPSGVACLKAESAFGRSMALEGGGADCSLAPDHAFTRRATIVGTWNDFRLVTFGFFLTVITWRRAANNNSGSAAG